MGNCATCRFLSRESANFTEEEGKESMMVSSAATTTPHVYSYLKPMNPCAVGPLLANLDLLQHSLTSTQPLNSAHPAHNEEDDDGQAPSPPIQIIPPKAKVAKKVSFAKNLVQSPPSSPQPTITHMQLAAPHECLPAATCHAQDADAEVYESLASGKASWGHVEELSASLVTEEKPTAYNRIEVVKKKEAMNEVVRVKVVITKKQLAELTHGARSALPTKQAVAGDVLMQKMVASLLVATPLPQLVKSAKSGQSWKPSLDHIPEAYSSNHQLCI